MILVSKQNFLYITLKDIKNTEVWTKISTKFFFYNIDNKNNKYYQNI